QEPRVLVLKAPSLAGATLTFKPAIRNLETKSARTTLRGIARGRLSRCVLVWVPLAPARATRRATRRASPGGGGLAGQAAAFPETAFWRRCASGIECAHRGANGPGRPCSLVRPGPGG